MSENITWGKFHSVAKNKNHLKLKKGHNYSHTKVVEGTYDTKTIINGSQETNANCSDTTNTEKT